MTYREKMLALETEMNAQVLGQEELVRMLIVALLCDGHVLLEGLPGLAKTRAVRELAKHLEGDFCRIQFTPDLLPSDITGSEIYQQNATREEDQFRFRPGPVFGNIILADEINRASARVQSALLEAMEERHVTVAGKTWPLPGVYGAGNAKPHRSGRHLAVTRSAARPLSDENPRQLSVAGKRTKGDATGAGRAAAQYQAARPDAVAAAITRRARPT